MAQFPSQYETAEDNFGSITRDNNTNIVTTSPKTYYTTPSLISLDNKSYITSEPSTIPNELFPQAIDSQPAFIPPIPCTEGAHNSSANKPNPKRQNTFAALARGTFKRKRRETLATLAPAAPSSVFYSDTESATNLGRCHELKENPAPSARAKQGEIVKFWRKITRRWSEGDAHMHGRPTLVSNILRFASIVKEREAKEAKETEEMKKSKKSKEEAAVRNEDEDIHAMKGKKVDERTEKQEGKQDKQDRELTSDDLATSKLVSDLVAHGCKDFSESIDQKTFSEAPVACGGLSDIYRGQLFDGTLVAVKAWRILAQQTISESTEQIRHAAYELYTWSKCNHPNVLRLLGLATFRGRIGMVSPWMRNGTLPQYVRANPNANRRDLCVQICEGLSYLHATGIVHGDLKGANVLVSDDGTPVLADFGSSTMKDQTLKITLQGGNHSLTVRWSAPELLEEKYSGRYTKYSDVYSLGMTIYEIITGNVPYHREGGEVRVMALLLKGTLPVRPVCTPTTHESSDKLWNLFLLCWKYAPEGRPSAIEVTEMMRVITLEGATYQMPVELNPMPESPTVARQTSVH